MVFESIEMCRPEFPVALEPLIELDQRFGPDAIEPTLRVDPRFDNSRFLQHPKVLRHRRLAQLKAFDQLSDGPLPIPQQIEDGLAARLSKNLKRRGDWHGSEYATQVI
jgi:hypothetical protein